MPARKPADLVIRAETKAARKERRDGEAAMQPKRQLPKQAPAALKGHVAARRLGEKMIRLYGELDAQIVSLLDQDMLTDYCLLVEQAQELDQMRKSAMRAWRAAQKAFDRLSRKKIANAKEFAKLLTAINSTFDDVVKLDARADRKRSLLLALRQSLYLTPRSRAGVNPPEKQPEKPKSKLGALIDAADKAEKT
jgi:cobalamin-dependent methionine synthase I